MKIDLRRLSAGYARTTVLHHLNLVIKEDEWLGVIGPNGAGKSTLLRALAGLIPYEGTVAIGEGDITSRRQRARTVALVPQDPAMPPGLTVAEYVLLGRTPHISYLGRERPSDLAAAAEAMELLDLKAFTDRHLDELSGGEQQRVVLARALAQEPGVLLLDEPTSALDIGHQLASLDMIGSLRSQRPMTIVSAMHDLTMAGRYADRLALLSKGRIVGVGAPAEVLTADNLERYYAADVKVLTVDGELVVVPLRATP